MTLLDDALTTRTLPERIVGGLSGALSRVSRRGFLVSTAVVGSAIVADPKGYVLTPGSAYSAICGPGQACNEGWTVFCCTINKGLNTCPPGTFAAGWWKASDSSWCCGGYRYIVDCNATCSGCTSGCSGDHICDKSCWSCSCRCGSTATCDSRRVCCNAFRYGQCNTHVSCSGGVACRVASCVAPYKWDNCTTTSLSDNRTREHSAPCQQGCGPILTYYNSLGANGSALGGSAGPERASGDGRGRYVRYVGGTIVWRSDLGARHVIGKIHGRWLAVGAERGLVGYPLGAEALTADRRSRVQRFERGTIIWGLDGVAREVVGPIDVRWRATGGQAGPLGYPTSYQQSTTDGLGGRFSTFTGGTIIWRSATGAHDVRGAVRTTWLSLGGYSGVLGYPVSDDVVTTDGRGGRYTHFERGTVIWLASLGAFAVTGVLRERWFASGAHTGAYGYPTGPARTLPDGRQEQPFEGGVLRTRTKG